MTTSAATAVSARGVCRRFGSRWALVNVDVDVPVGGALMITGANGSGKTTLLRCIATALPIHRGDIDVFGQPLWAARNQLRPRMALVSHATRLYEDLGAVDNLVTWARLGGMNADPAALLARVGLDASRKEPVRAYSAGMRRRVALAIALLKRPDLVLLDEPFAALDPDGRAMVAGIVRDFRAAGASVIIATHLPQVTGPLCDAALHLDAGAVTWRGLPADAPAGLEPDPS
jgi:ABC-2 type transport system ATP-binding protein